MKKIISGKVRDVYEVNDSQLAIVTTDRISAFDVILNSTIPGKGIALNTLSNFWFAFTEDIIPSSTRCLRNLISIRICTLKERFW